jgi:hypothetical protein
MRFVVSTFAITPSYFRNMSGVEKGYLNGRIVLLISLNLDRLQSDSEQGPW